MGGYRDFLIISIIQSQIDDHQWGANPILIKALMFMLGPKYFEKKVETLMPIC